MKISNKLFTKLEELLDESMSPYSDEAGDIARVMLNSLMILKENKRLTDKELTDGIRLLSDLLQDE